MPIVGTSLGGMWALCLALDAPDRVAAVASLGVPAVALPGMHGDPFFTALSTPGLRQLVARIRSPNVATTRRSVARGVIGPRAAERAPEGFFEVVHEGMRQPGFRTAMLSHMWLAMRLGRPRPENFLSDAELRQLTVPVLMIWGDEDPYGGPEIGRRACELLPDARLEVIPGRHAPFLDDPERCGALIDELVRRATPTHPESPQPESSSPMNTAIPSMRVSLRVLREPSYSPAAGSVASGKRVPIRVPNSAFLRRTQRT